MVDDKERGEYPRSHQAEQPAEQGELQEGCRLRSGANVILVAQGYQGEGLKMER